MRPPCGADHSASRRAQPARLDDQRIGKRDHVRIPTRALQEPLSDGQVSIEDTPGVEARVVDFFCKGTGGPETYSGRDMLNTHRGMNLSEPEFVSVIDDAMVALASHQVEPATQNEALGILWSLKGQIVRV